MYTSVLTALGGLGLFLLGMQLMTNGLRSLAGNRLRQVLKTSTKTPRSGAVTGAIVTALLQSSSATTVATVGFVSAGLMTFPQALGVIFGANIGTTFTGWMVVIFGFKLKLDVIVLPLVFIGVLLKIFGPGTWKTFGTVLAGFSLLFIGISALQDGMAFFEGSVSPDIFPGDTWFGRFELVLIGAAITIVAQSSSAGVATALVALTAGAITFPQAAALVVGMNVGTTATAALATVGGSVATRRTGYAHVIYNLLTGVIAFFLLPLVGHIARHLQASPIGFDPQIGLVAFHSLFNILGVLIVIGVTPQFARLVMFLVPARGPDLTARLDQRLLKDPAAALDAARVTVRDINRSAMTSLSRFLGKPKPAHPERELETLQQAIETTQSFASEIHTQPADGPLYDEHRALFHNLDHLERLLHRCRQSERIATLDADPVLHKKATKLRNALDAATAADLTPETSVHFNLLRKELRESRHSYRSETIDRASRDEIATDDAMARLDAMRWLHRVTYHIWRMSHHQLVAEGAFPPAPPPRGSQA
ncbi:Na/Pi cotransporter family protein [Roseibium aggregatum]|uniref:Na/Pi cotransporter family protein n=1 Tax=Roseibium aggregatum TaxID=187304 RepID=A0A926S7F7_9HYPH|nr:Na/Pi symporter [Roseibium aggregatum]MBD1547462.1 Na/Pi cotransporter family protein [Roseibium aggregatum]